MLDIKVFKKSMQRPKTSADGLFRGTLSMLDEIASKTVHKYKEDDDE